MTTPLGQAPPVSQAGIEILSQEVLYHVFDFLPQDCLGQAATACKQWTDLIQDETRWKYICLKRGWLKKDETQSWRDFAKAQAHDLAVWRISFVQGEVLNCTSLHPTNCAWNFQSDSLISIDGNLLAVCQPDPSITIEIWDLNTLKKVSSFEEKEENLGSLYKISLCNSYVAVSFADSEASLIKTKLYHTDGKVVELSGDFSFARSTTHPAWYVVCERDGINAYNPRTGELMHTLPCQLANSPMILDNLLIVRKFFGELYSIWDLNSGNCLGEHLTDDTDLGYAFSGNKLVTLNEQEVLGQTQALFKVYDFGKDEEVLFSFPIKEHVTGFNLEGNILSIKTVNSWNLYLVNIVEQKIMPFCHAYLEERFSRAARTADLMSWKDRVLYVFRTDNVEERWDFSESTEKVIL